MSTFSWSDVLTVLIVNNDQHVNSLEIRASAICCQRELSLDRCQQMLACLPIQKQKKAQKLACGFVHPCIFRLLQSQFCEYRMFFSLTPGLWKFYLCSTFHSNKNTMCFKEKSNRSKNTNINTCTYIHTRWDETRLMIKVCVLFPLCV